MRNFTCSLFSNQRERENNVGGVGSILQCRRKIADFPSAKHVRHTFREAVRRAKTSHIESHLPLCSPPQDMAVTADVERRERAVVSHLSTKMLKDGLIYEKDPEELSLQGFCPD